MELGEKKVELEVSGIEPESSRINRQVTMCVAPCLESRS